MTDKQIMIDGKECRYWFRPNPSDYRKCSLRGKNDNCDEINDCLIKELVGGVARKEQECNKCRQTLTEIEESAMCIMDDDLEESSAYYNAKQILQKISECKVENEYNTKDIRHINEKNQERIAEGNRMTK